MIVKIAFGNGRNERHLRIIDCYDIHIEKDEKEDFDILICHVRNRAWDNNQEPRTIHLGKGGQRDHVYIMDNGKTADHMVFENN